MNITSRLRGLLGRPTEPTNPAVDRDDLNPQPVPTSDRRSPRRLRSRVKSLAVAGILAVALVLAARYSLQSFGVSGRSMAPTVGSGQMVLVDKITYDFFSPQREDIVVFHVPHDPAKLYIKRIIAIPGDRVQIHGGRVWLNGRALSESYIAAPSDYTMNVIPGTRSDLVPPSEYFVLGDNRPTSNDSHRWGLVPRDDIIGRAIVVYWPLNHFTVLSDPTASPVH